MTAHWGMPDPAAATGTPCGDRPGVRRHLPDAEQPHHALHEPADGVAGPALAAAPARRDRPAPRGVARRHEGPPATPASSRRARRSARARRLIAEALGTALLLAIVVGSGIMGERLSAGNDAIALLANTLATGASARRADHRLRAAVGRAFQPGRHAGVRDPPRDRLAAGRRLRGGAARRRQSLGVWRRTRCSPSRSGRCPPSCATGRRRRSRSSSPPSGWSATILGTLRFRPDATPAIVGLYITAAYWFTASTSFANPAVTFARALSNTFAGIAPSSAPLFIAAQIAGAAAATVMFGWLLTEDRKVQQRPSPLAGEGGGRQPAG